jgi:hypothetical protein
MAKKTATVSTRKQPSIICYHYHKKTETSFFFFKNCKASRLCFKQLFHKDRKKLFKIFFLLVYQFNSLMQLQNVKWQRKQPQSRKQPSLICNYFIAKKLRHHFFSLKNVARCLDFVSSNYFI